MIYVFVKIAVTVTIIAIASYVNIDAIKAIMPDLMAEAYIAMASGVIALIALLFAVVQGWQNQKHNRLSVRPMLETLLLHVPKGNYIRYFTYTLQNLGTGPAIIKNFILLYDGKEVSRNNLYAYRKFLEKELKIFKKQGDCYYGPNSVIGVGEKSTLWEFEYDSRTQNIDFVRKINIQIEYESIYKDETFTYPPK